MPTVDTLSGQRRGDRAGGLWAWQLGILYSITPEGLAKVLDLGAIRITTAVPAGPYSPGELMIGTDGGLFVCDLVTGAVEKLGGVPPVRSIVHDGRGGFWIATDDGLWTLERDRRPRSAPGGTPRWNASLAGLGGSVVLSLCRDATGTVWAGSLNGLYRKLTTSPMFSVFRHRDDNPNSLASNFVMPLMEDRTGRIWIGTLDGGVSVMTPGGAGGPGFRNFPMRSDGGNGPWGNNIRAIIQTRDGMIWMGTNAGLTVCDTGPKFLARYIRPPIVRKHAATQGIATPKVLAIQRHLGAGGQVLLYLNRRGYAPTLFCPACG